MAFVTPSLAEATPEQEPPNDLISSFLNRKDKRRELNRRNRRVQTQEKKMMRSEMEVTLKMVTVQKRGK